MEHFITELNDDLDNDEQKADNATDRTVGMA